MTLHIPSHNHSEAPAVGVSAATPILVPSLNAGDKLLALIITAPVASVDGLDVSDFTVSDGELESASVDTSGLSLLAIHTS